MPVSKELLASYLDQIGWPKEEQPDAIKRLEFRLKGSPLSDALGWAQRKVYEPSGSMPDVVNSMSEPARALAASALGGVVSPFTEGLPQGAAWLADKAGIPGAKGLEERLRYGTTAREESLGDMTRDNPISSTVGGFAGGLAGLAVPFSLATRLPLLGKAFSTGAPRALDEIVTAGGLVKNWLGTGLKAIPAGAASGFVSPLGSKYGGQSLETGIDNPSLTRGESIGYSAALAPLFSLGGGALQGMYSAGSNLLKSKSIPRAFEDMLSKTAPDLVDYFRNPNLAIGEVASGLRARATDQEARKAKDLADLLNDPAGSRFRDPTLPQNVPGKITDPNLVNVPTVPHISKIFDREYPPNSGRNPSNYPSSLETSLEDRPLLSALLTAKNRSPYDPTARTSVGQLIDFADGLEKKAVTLEKQGRLDDAASMRQTRADLLNEARNNNRPVVQNSLDEYGAMRAGHAAEDARINDPVTNVIAPGATVGKTVESNIQDLIRGGGSGAISLLNQIRNDYPMAHDALRSSILRKRYVEQGEVPHPLSTEAQSIFSPDGSPLAPKTQDFLNRAYRATESHAPTPGAAALRLPGTGSIAFRLRDLLPTTAKMLPYGMLPMGANPGSTVNPWISALLSADTIKSFGE